MAVTLVVSGPGAALRPITFDQPRIVIGRGAHADVRLPSRAVSDVHAVIKTEGLETVLLDEGSTNGTRVNGQVVPRGRRKVLHGGDVVGIAGYELRVEVSSAIADPPERTGTLARRLLLDALGAAGEEASPPTLTLRAGRPANAVWTLPSPPSRVVIGRGETCEVALDDADCSRQHAEVLRDADGAVLRDLGSKNGVFVGNRRISERRLRHGDEIQLGASVLVYADPAEELLHAFDGGADESAPAPAEPPRPLLPAPEPAPPAAVAEAVPAPARPPKRTADWVVVGLAVVILAVSLAALLLVLRGGARP